LSVKETEETNLDPELAALITSMHTELERMDLFTLLDCDLNADRSVLQRAYFNRSRVFHPDRYFNRRLGPYKKMLERIFAWISASYNFLKDDRRRAAYRKKILNARGDDKATCGGRVVAVETAKGLEFVITDEASFYGPDDAEKPDGPNVAGAEQDAAQPPGARAVGLPQKKYTLPKVRRAEAPAKPAAEAPDEVNDLVRKFLDDD
jgi:curved DNA-binding protein CbpA